MMCQDAIARQIARRVVRWAAHVNTSCDVMRTSGYCMSGSWSCFYQRHLFPDKKLQRDRLDALILALRQRGFLATLEVTPFPDETGLTLYMQLVPIR